MDRPHQMESCVLLLVRAERILAKASSVRRSLARLGRLPHLHRDSSSRRRDARQAILLFRRCERHQDALDRLHVQVGLCEWVAPARCSRSPHPAYARPAHEQRKGSSREARRPPTTTCRRPFRTTNTYCRRLSLAHASVRSSSSRRARLPSPFPIEPRRYWLGDPTSRRCGDGEDSTFDVDV